MSFNFTVVARADGRGGIKPFMTYGSKQAGATVNIGEKAYKVTKDGRVNIPKSVMDKYGVLNNEGRRVINIRFKTDTGVEHWKKVYAEVKKPDKSQVNKQTGEIATKQVIGDERKTLEPKDAPDKSWSPLN